MGAKAKQAINNALSALSKMDTAVASLEKNYKDLFTAAEFSIELNISAGGKGGEVEKAKSDTERKKLVAEHAKLEAQWLQAKALCQKMRAACRSDVEDIKSTKKDLDVALKAIETLVLAKQKKRDESKGVLKKLVNMTKTKSLGDLRAEYTRIARANNNLADKMLGIDPFFFKE